MSINRLVDEHGGKLVLAALLLLLAILQYFIWLGDHGFGRLWHLQRTVDNQKYENQELRVRNERLHAEVTDLKKGTDALEERARSELGLIKEDETFYQVLEPNVKKQSTKKQ